jgi:hypothetical protein
MNFKGGGTTVITFHRNTDGGPPHVYELKGNIEAAIKLLNSTAVFLKPDENMLPVYRMGQEQPDRWVKGTPEPSHPAYGPGSITDAATYETPDEAYRRGMQTMRDKLPDTEKYKEGWNAAIEAILKLSANWMYHTGGEDPPYHLPCISNEHKAEINNLRKRE